MKRMITGNTGPGGILDSDNFQKAVLQYRNSPDPATKISPAMAVFGRPVKDLVAILPGKYLPHQYWRDILADREETLQKRHSKDHDRWSEHTRTLPQLMIGDLVRIQNQTGQFPNKWDKTGCIVEVRQHHQYLVRVDGSRRLTLRNRQFLRRYHTKSTSYSKDMSMDPPAQQFIPPTPPAPRDMPVLRAQPAPPALQTTTAPLAPPSTQVASPSPPQAIPYTPAVTPAAPPAPPSKTSTLPLPLISYDDGQKTRMKTRSQDTPVLKRTPRMKTRSQDTPVSKKTPRPQRLLSPQSTTPMNIVNLGGDRE